LGACKKGVPETMTRSNSVAGKKGIDVVGTVRQKGKKESARGKKEEAKNI